MKYDLPNGLWAFTCSPRCSETRYVFVRRVCSLHSFVLFLKNAEHGLRFRGMINSLLLAGTVCVRFGLFLEACDPAPEQDLLYSQDSLLWNKCLPCLSSLYPILGFQLEWKTGFWWHWASCGLCMKMSVWEMRMYLTQLGASTFAWHLFWQLSNSRFWQSKRQSTSESNSDCTIQSKNLLFHSN